LNSARFHPNSDTGSRRDARKGTAIWRYLLFIVIGFAGVLLYMKFLGPKPQPPASQPAATRPAGMSPGPGPDSRAVPPESSFQSPTAKANYLVIRNDSVAVRATGRGARLLSVRLLGFGLFVTATEDEKKDPEKCLELIYHSGAPVSALSLFLDGALYADPTHPLHGLVGKLETADWDIEKIPADAEHGEGIRFRLAVPPFEFIKTLRLDRTGYRADFVVEAKVIDASVENSQNASATLQFQFLPAGWLFSDFDQFFPSPYAIAGSAVEGKPVSSEIAYATAMRGLHDASTPVWGELKQRQPDQQGQPRDRFTYIADANKFFVAGAIPKNPATADGIVATRSLGIVTMSDDGRPEPRVASVAVLQSKLPKLAQPIRYEFTAYFGPKEFDALAGAPELHEVHNKDRGSFLSPGWLADGISGMLRLIQKGVGNWGVAIIVLTILLRIAIFPLTRRSQVTMAEFAAKQALIKPKLDELTKRLKDNPKKLNEERLKLFKENNVPIAPPVLGCLPIFLNIPIFVGFFSALKTMYELRHQPFAFWIHDLSRPDQLIHFGGSFSLPLVGEVRGLNILAILMIVMWIANQIVSMRVMQKATDPQQAMMQKFTMGLTTIMGFALYNYASGLAIYSITSSTITLTEQTLIRKLWPPPTAAQIQASKKA
jgi:YidC/Oxa1 family membrane protein insertase